MESKLIRQFLLMAYFASVTTFVQVLLASVAIATPVYAQNESIENVSVKLETQSLTVRSLFEEIEQQTPFLLAYNQGDISLDTNLSLPEVTMTVADVLRLVATQEAVSFRRINSTIYVRQLESNAEPVVEEVEVPAIVISGTVTDENGEPIPGVTIQIKGTSTGTISAADGSFALDVPEDAVLVFSAMGFETVEVPVGNQTNISVTMEDSLQRLEDIVVVGYGTTIKKDLTGSVSSIEASDIGDFPSASVDQALTGKMAGVQVSANSGQPGAGAQVYVRGLSNIRGDNQPLYVIDGVPIVINPATGNVTTPENPLLMVNPNDIARIDVLKDASAAAIYGSRAANGVVIITTKSGSFNRKPTVTFTSSASWQNPNREFNYLNAEEFIAYQTMLAENQLLTQPTAEPALSIVNDPDFFGDANTDWQDEITNNNAFSTEYYVGINGGTENIAYSVSASYSDMEGVMFGNTFDRYSLRSNLEIQAAPRLTLGLNANYNYTDNVTSLITSQRAAEFRPDLPVYYPDGSPSLGQASQQLGFAEFNNPVAGNGQGGGAQIAKSFYTNVSAEYDFSDWVKGLSFKSVVALSTFDDNSSSFEPSFSERGLSSSRLSYEGGTRNNGSSVRSATVFTNSFQYENTFAGVHKISAVAGYEWNAFYGRQEFHTYNGYLVDEALIDVGSASNVIDFGSNAYEQGLVSAFVRANYSYDNRYLATFTARRDGSNKFGPENQFGTFPSFAVAWNAHNEAFLSNVDFISQLKLRTSWGISGSDNLPAFTYETYLGVLPSSNTTYNGVVGIAPLGLANTAIRWEETEQFDLGLNFGLFNDRIYGEVNYFSKYTSGIILNTPVSPETSFSTTDQNIADVSNTGWEIMIGGDILRRPELDLRWSSSVNISFVQNNIEALNGGRITPQDNGLTLTEGEPVGTSVGYQVIKVADTQEEIDALNASAPDGTYYAGLLAPGDYIYTDQNGDGEITQEDFVPIGNITPDYFGGWNNTVSFKGFELAFNFQFVQGVEKNLLSIGQWLENDAPTLENIPRNIYEDSWTETNTDARFARIGSPTLNDLQDRSIFDASFVRFRTLRLGYNLPTSLLEQSRTGLKSLRVYVQANNLYTWTDYPGIDPEIVGGASGNPFDTVGTRRSRSNAYPLVRTITAGLNLTF